MNYYIRFFDKDVLVSSYEEAYDFLASIPQIKMDDVRGDILKKFIEGPSKFPLRLKVTPKVYALVLKTDETDIDKLRGGNSNERHLTAPMPDESEFGNHRPADMAVPPIDEWKRRTYDRMMQLNDEVPGIYEGCLIFKRVVPIEENSMKVCYKDTRFTARMRAFSGLDCYNQIVEHLKGRQDVDPRSQYPSAKSSKFDFKLLARDEEPFVPQTMVTDIPEAVADEERKEGETNE